jgi:hypothetical protein
LSVVCIFFQQNILFFSWYEVSQRH